MGKPKTDCVNSEGHVYIQNGHVARCKHCYKTQIYNPVTKTWEDPKR